MDEECHSVLLLLRLVFGWHGENEPSSGHTASVMCKSLSMLLLDYSILFSKSPQMDMRLGEKVHQTSSFEIFLPAINAIQRNITKKELFKESQQLMKELDGPLLFSPYTNHLRHDDVLEEQQQYPYITNRFTFKLVERLKGYKIYQSRKRPRVTSHTEIPTHEPEGVLFPVMVGSNVRTMNDRDIDDTASTLTDSSQRIDFRPRAATQYIEIGERTASNNEDENRSSSTLTNPFEDNIEQYVEIHSISSMSVQSELEQSWEIPEPSHHRSETKIEDITAENLVNVDQIWNVIIAINGH
ncbi:hypothetical protein BC833DRAFT_626632 [Globomyces pollinis-pini]|nr:hypothetical protein BC833DRAFT_626632 [Globomyces pollinis-pini]